MPKIKSSKIIIDGLLYDFKQDKRFLIPFITGTKIGFCDNERNIVIPASFSTVLDDFTGDLPLVRVGNYIPVSYKLSASPYLRLQYGLINCKGTFVLPLEYEGIAAPECSTRFTVRSLEKGYAVFDE